MTLKLYAAGPKAGTKDQTWKSTLQTIVDRINKEWKDQGGKEDLIEVLDPDRYGIKDSPDAAAEIVRRNTMDVVEADIIVLFCGSPSAGGTIESVLGKLFGADVFLVTPGAWISLSVWLMHLFPARGTWQDFDNWLRSYM